jgi:hypothetical protein
VIEGGRPENGPREHEKDDPGRVWQGFWNFATRTQITLTTDIKDILLALRSKKLSAHISGHWRLAYLVNKL